jgi:hypothetical protein
VALGWLWGGFEVPIAWLSTGFDVALMWLSGGFLKDLTQALPGGASFFL